MAPTPDRPIIFSLDQTVPKQFSINPKSTSFDPNRPENSEVYGKYFSFKSRSDYNKHVNIPCNEVITSNNVHLSGLYLIFFGHQPVGLVRWKSYQPEFKLTSPKKMKEGNFPCSGAYDSIFGRFTTFSGVR